MNMEKTTNVGGTFLRGYIKASYENLVTVFGEPHDPNGDNYKTDVEWAFEFADGTIATLYNWKNGKNYLGEAEGLELDDIYEWNVGGNSDKAVSKLLEKLRA
tara:strand:- start:390 stop:695 length:306 start_codon:yes stop_codon:yes gene_type:complete